MFYVVKDNTLDIMKRFQCSSEWKRLKKLKALIIKNGNLDVDKVVHYAYAEGKKLFKTRKRIIVDRSNGT